MGPGSGLALDGGGARAVVLTLGSVLNVKQLLLKSLLLFLLNVKTQKQCFSVNVEQLYPGCSDKVYTFLEKVKKLKWLYLDNDRGVSPTPGTLFIKYLHK